MNYIIVEHCGGIYLQPKQYYSINSRTAKTRSRVKRWRKMFVLEEGTD